MVGLGALEGGILMRIPDYRNVHGVKDLNHWTTKTSRVDRVHKDGFEKELENSIYKRKSEAKTKRKKETQKEHLALIDENQELDKMKLKIDHLLKDGGQRTTDIPSTM